MAPTPITADFRVTFLYTVLGLQHHFTSYCEAAPSGDALGYDVLGRPTGGNTGLSTLDSAFFTVVAPFFRTADCTFDSMVFEERSGVEWIFRASQAATVTPSGSGVSQKAFQYGIFGKFADNTRVNRYVYETSLSNPNRYTSYSALAAADQALVNYMFNNSGGAWATTDYYNWGRSRGVSLVNRWISVVTDTNEKLRRIRAIK